MEDKFRAALQVALRGDNSHPNPFEVLDGLRSEDAGRKHEAFSFTAYQLARHLIDWTKIILQSVQGEKFELPEDWTNFYPRETAPSSEGEWESLQAEWKEIGKQCEQMLDNFDPDVIDPTWKEPALNNVMVLFTHNSYHSAQIVAVRKAMGNWDNRHGSGELG